MKRAVAGLLGLVCVLALFGYNYVGNMEGQQVEQSQQLESQAKAVLAKLNAKLKSLQAAVDKMAQQAGESAKELSPEGRSELALQLSESRAEGLLKVRVLGLDPVVVDRESVPPMSYAGLEMARTSQSSGKPALAEFHMLGTEAEHLALVSPIKKAGEVKGVVVASFDVRVIKELMQLPGQTPAWLELKQGALSVAGFGDKSFKNTASLYFLKSAGGSWRLMVRKSYPRASINQSDIILYALALCVVIILAGLMVFLLLNKELAKGLVAKLRGSVKGRQEKLKKTFKAKQVGSTGKSGEADKSLSLPEVKEGPEGGLARSSASKKGGSKAGGASKAEVSKEIFRAYDIRGVVDETLTEVVVYEIARAIGSEIIDAAQTSVVVARDGRLHSERLSKSLVKGLRATGCDVIDVGQVPTPVLYFSTHNLDATSGVMITGSHNPANYNGLKIVINGETLAEAAIMSLYERVIAGEFSAGEGGYKEQMMLPEYIGAISTDVKMGRMMKVVVDCGNGVAGEAAPMLLSTLGCEVVPLFCDIDGNFPNHHPDPSRPENLQALIDKVKEEEAELGLAFDGDGDRLGVVDSAGYIIWPDRQLMLYAIDVLSRQAGADIVFDVKCSKNVEKVIAEHGGRPVMSKTGHSLMKAKIKETGAELGGEMSGHIFFKERWFGFDDALYTAARLVEILSSEFRSTADMFSDIPDGLSTPELNIPMQEGESFALVSQLVDSAAFEEAKLITIDGLRVEFADGWGLLRASNTTPSLVLRFEADNEEALVRIQQDFGQLILAIKPDIQLPF